MSERPLFDLDPWSRREDEGSEFFERSHPVKPHVRLIALLVVLGLVASSAFVVLSMIFGG
jgi:hypothetical protein